MQQKKVTIYTLADKRPDYIEIQYESLKKYIVDDYEYVVLNNAIDSLERHDEIAAICKRLSITCVDVEKELRYSIIGKQRVFARGVYTNPNVACAYPLKWAWDDICTYNHDKLFMIIDSDMFPCRKLSINEALGDHDAAYIAQYRGMKERRAAAYVTYIWNAICIFNPSKIANLRKLNWNCGVSRYGYINGYAVDVGGYAHYWLLKNKVNVKHLSEYAIYRYTEKKQNKIQLETTLNGGYHYFFTYDRKTKTITDAYSKEQGWQPGDYVLPHLPKDFELVIQQKMIALFEQYILDRQTYPEPTILGFIEFETLDSQPAPVFIHIKGGSGYMGFSEEYGRLKLAFVEKLLHLK